MLTPHLDPAQYGSDLAVADALMQVVMDCLPSELASDPDFLAEESAIYAFQDFVSHLMTTQRHNHYTDQF